MINHYFMLTLCGLFFIQSAGSSNYLTVLQSPLYHHDPNQLDLAVDELLDLHPVSVIHSCNSRATLNVIADGKRNSTAVVFVHKECDAREIVHSPFCWGHKAINAGILAACGHKDELYSIGWRFHKRNSYSHQYVLSTTSILFADAIEDENIRTRAVHRTSQPKKNTKLKNVKRKSSEKQTVHDSEAKKENDLVKLQTIEDKSKCKYRKSCYDDNAVVVEENIELTKADDRIEDNRNDENEISGKNIDNDDDDIDKDQLRVQCKYRYSCYAEKGLKSTKNEKEKKDKNKVIKRIITSKASTIKAVNSHQNKVSIKDHTASALRQLEKRVRRSNDLPKASQAEQLITHKKEQENYKYKCKYRKSCYETGNPSTIKTSFESIGHYISFFNGYQDADDKNEENEKSEGKFEDMTTEQQKLFCKYRKRCYDTGVSPNIHDDNNFIDNIIIKNNQKKVSMPLRCKYRKSCYETGVLPKTDESVEEKEKNSNVVLPTNTIALKLFCKYRITCYKQMSKKTSEENYEAEADEGKDETVQKEETDEKVYGHMKNDEENNIVDINVVGEPKSSSTVIKEELEEKTEVNVKKVSTKMQKSKTSRPHNMKSQQVTSVKKKKTTEQLCETFAANEKVSTEIKADAPIYKRLKGRQPPQRPRGTLEDEDVIVILKKRHLRKLFKAGPKEDVKHNTELKKTDSVIDKHEDNVDTVNIKKNINTSVHINEVLSENNSKNKDNEKTNMNMEVPIKVNKESNKREDAALETMHIAVKSIDNLAKLKCKYRKSCYDKKDIDDFNINEGNSGKESILFRSSYHQQQDKTNKDWDQIKKDEQLKCKYRKSCYDSQTAKYHGDETIKIIYKASNDIRKLHSNPSNHAIKNEIEFTKEDITLSKEMKHKCKYRHSCYEDNFDVENASKEKLTIVNTSKNIENYDITEDKNQIVFILPNGTVCSKYRISCRREMGLPLKERTPIGPNGKKLCRKKRPVENTTDQSM